MKIVPMNFGRVRENNTVKTTVSISHNHKSER